MELKDSIYPKINNTKTRLLLAMALGVGEQAIRYYIKTKSDSLTKVAAVNVIKQVTGLSTDEILEPMLTA